MKLLTAHDICRNTWTDSCGRKCTGTLLAEAAGAPLPRDGESLKTEEHLGFQEMAGRFLVFVGYGFDDPVGILCDVCDFNNENSREYIADRLNAFFEQEGLLTAPGVDEEESE